METKKTEAGQAGRRDFLKLSALGVAAGAVAASSTAQAIDYANIPGWPATYARVISAGIDVITAEATGTTKNVSFGYAGATTAFVNAQSAAAIGVIPGAGATANLATTALSYTLSANNWAEAVMKAWITVECIG